MAFPRACGREGRRHVRIDGAGSAGFLLDTRCL
jgi:hypothetical protein